MTEEIDISIKLKKKNNYKIISDALLAADFKFDHASDTLLIATAGPDWVVGGLPHTLLAKSSKSVKLLSECDSVNEMYKEDMELISSESINPPLSYYHTNAYAFMVFKMSNEPNIYAENYFKMVSPKYPEAVKEFYLEEMLGKYPENYYAMMYHGDIDAFRKFYIKNIGIVLGGYDEVVRIVIKDGKVVPPTLMWTY